MGSSSSSSSIHITHNTTPFFIKLVFLLLLIMIEGIFTIKHKYAITLLTSH